MLSYHIVGGIELLYRREVRSLRLLGRLDLNPCLANTLPQRRRGKLRWRRYRVRAGLRFGSKRNASGKCHVDRTIWPRSWIRDVERWPAAGFTRRDPVDEVHIACIGRN